MTDASILRAVATHYESTLARHGPTAAGVDWKDHEGQQLRHWQFLRLLAEDPDASVLDFGCGYGDLLPFLRAQGHRGRYVGVDVAPAMIAAARKRHGESDAHRFRVASRADEAADFAIASGVLNVRRGATPELWEAHCGAVLDALARSARRGFGFNMLSLCSDPERRRADLHYADPAATLAATMARHGRRVALLHDYGLWEFTVLVRHGG